MNLQPRLENDLVIVRPLLDNESDVLYEVACDPLIWAQHHSWDRYKKEVFVKFFDDAIVSKSAFAIEEKSTGKVIGSSRYKVISMEDKVVEIGWTFLSRDKWGGKYNRLVKKLMIDHAFEYFNYVILNITKENMRSQKAAEKIGARRVEGPEWNFLMKKDDTYFTYVIQKKA